ncbi:MAG: PIN domain-containing protein [Pseudonocardiaceae bacterium]|nr:PIN domain-containing protein [Pseudonocardiaceae bacterium]
MTLLVDAAPLVALADRRDPLRDGVRAVLEAERGALVIPAPVTAEIDYLLGRRIGRLARLAFLDDLATGRFTVECLAPDEYPAVTQVDRGYPELDLGLADCATVVLAARLRTLRVLTFDERHFRAVRPLQGGVFELLPQR